MANIVGPPAKQLPSSGGFNGPRLASPTKLAPAVSTKFNSTVNLNSKHAVNPTKKRDGTTKLISETNSFSFSNVGLTDSLAPTKEGEARNV